jgi:hypothetical protein
MAPKPMSMHKAVWNDEDKVMIVTGGKSGQNYLWDTWAFDPSTALWTERAHMPSSWVDHSMVWYREEKRAFVFGGMAASEYNDALYIYDYDVDKWVLGVKGPEARYGHAAAWGDGRMAVFCGDDSSDYLNETWVYDYYMNRTTGWLVSSQVDLGRNVDFIGLDWQADVPNETWIGFQLATNKDHLTWDFLGPDGTTGTQFNASMKAIPDVHDGNRYFSYKVSMSSQNRTRTPGLTSFSLTYRYYETPGLFVSSVIDLLSDGPIVHSIGWDTIEPDGTDIRMTVTSGPNPDLSSPTLENMSIANGDGIPENVSRYLVYTAKLTTLNASLTPVLQEVRINYTPIPALSSGIVDKASGIEGEMFNFTVIYTDLAERPPTVAQVVIDGTPFDLATAASSFSTGASFLYGTTLATGMHNYYFNFKVGDIVLRFPDSGTLPGPNVKALNQGPKAVITLPREGDTPPHRRPCHLRQ